MSRTFTKLCTSITESTVWCESDRTRLVWICMLAMADRVGRVFGSIPGLANRARVPVEDTRIAVAKFLAPDPDSRTPDFEGRRIEPIEGGWRLLNYGYYRALRDEESILESKRKYINARRAREREGVDKSVDKVDIGRSQVDPCIPKQKKRHLSEADASSPPSGDFLPGFAAFWNAWPKNKRKGAKGKCEEVWRKKHLEPVADTIVAHVTAMAGTVGWTKEDGEFVPAPLVYLGGARWEGADITEQAEGGQPEWMRGAI